MIAACLEGDRVAWASLVERYERLIYAIPLRYGLSEGQAADIFQDVCLILLQKLDQLRDERRLAGWLATTTRRSCWRAMRRRDGAGPEDPTLLLESRAGDLPDPDEVVGDWEAFQAVRQGLARLGERCRTLLQLLYYRSPTPSYAMIAAELDIAEGSIGPTRARCLKKLQHAIGGRHYRLVR